MYEKTIVAASPTFSWKLPSKSDTVPLLVPFSTILTPGSALPSSSATVPLIIF